MNWRAPINSGFELKFTENGESKCMTAPAAEVEAILETARRGALYLRRDEARFPSADLDGPWSNYAAKGKPRSNWSGMEKVENRNTYKVQADHEGRQLDKCMIDAQTFLETKIEGQPRQLDGTYHPSEVYFAITGR